MVAEAIAGGELRANTYRQARIVARLRMKTNNRLIPLRQSPISTLYFGFINPACTVQRTGAWPCDDPSLIFAGGKIGFIAQENSGIRIRGDLLEPCFQHRINLRQVFKPFAPKRRRRVFRHAGIPQQPVQ